MSKWGNGNNHQFKYIPKNDKNSNNSNNEKRNQVTKYSSNIIKSEFAMVNGELNVDYQQILKGGCVYLPNHFCETTDLTLFNQLKKDISEHDNGIVHWSKHFKHEDPTFSDTFNNIIKKLSDDFKINIVQTRLNYYKNGTDWKPFHHDSHAYGMTKDGQIKENYTIGVSLGASRHLEFLHESSGLKFKFPQNNGDIFGFTSEVNKKFMHGVPREPNIIGERFSIIAWGEKNN